MRPTRSLMTPGGWSYRAGVRSDLVRFAQASAHPLGFAWLDEAGRPEPSRPVELWITCRMTHVAALAVLADEPAAPGGPDRAARLVLAEHGASALRGALRDPDHGGWFASVGPGGLVQDAKQAYGHAFVVLAAASAQAAGLATGVDLLDEALTVHDRYFWDEEAGLVVEEWDRSWAQMDGYRGINANMHTVEAYLAAGDVTGNPLWHERAGRIAATVAGWARAHGWRIPEHFDAAWSPMLSHHREKPADPFRPYGATVGHGLEWARLLVCVDETLGRQAPPGLVAAAVAMTDRAVADGWAVDGAEGFIYTTDWDGRPVVHTRMHWVVAEAVNTATVLHRVTGEQRFADDAARWWAYADRFLVDPVSGSWHHELDASNTPVAEVWPGKPDVYHAYQAALLPDLPTTPSLAMGLASRQGAGCH